MRKLDTWPKLGIVLSALWIVVAATSTWAMMGSQAATFASLAPAECEHLRDVGQQWSTPDHCWDNYASEFHKYDAGRAQNMAFNALVPIPIAWLLVFGIVAIVRWFLRRPH